MTTLSELLTRALQVYDEQVENMNSNVRIGSLFRDIVDFLDTKQDKETGKGLSSNDFSNNDKTNLTTLVGLLNDNPDNVLNTISEVFKILESYPEGVKIADLLAAKLEKGIFTGTATDLSKNIFKKWCIGNPNVILTNNLNNAIYDSISDIYISNISDSGNWISNDWELFVGAVGLDTNSISTATTVRMGLFLADKTYLSTTGHYVQSVFNLALSTTQKITKSVVLSTGTGSVTINIVFDISSLKAIMPTLNIAGSWWWINYGVAQSARTFLIDKTKTIPDQTQQSVDLSTYALNGGSAKTLKAVDDSLTATNTNVANQANITRPSWMKYDSVGVLQTKDVSFRSIKNAIIDAFFTGVNDIDNVFKGSTWDVILGAIGFSTASLTDAITTASFNFYIADQTGLTGASNYKLFQKTVTVNIYKLTALSVPFTFLNGSAATLNLIIDFSKFDLSVNSLIDGKYYILNVGVQLPPSGRIFCFTKKIGSVHDYYKLLEPVAQKATITAIQPGIIYTTCNDASAWDDSYSQKSLNVYVERLLLLTSKIYCKFSDGKLIKNITSRRYFHPEYASAGISSSDYANFGETVHTVSVTDQVIGDNIDSIGITFNHISTRSSASKNKFIPVLQLGDSNTELGGSSRNRPSGMPGQSWSYLRYFFDVDNLSDFGNRSIRPIGVKTSSSYILNSNTIKTYAEGYSGWSTLDLLKVKSFDNGNRFYDPAKIYSNLSLSGYGVKFSLTKYISRYRTMTDAGDRLFFDSSGSTTGVGGSEGYIFSSGSYILSGITIGTEVTNTSSYDVCTPRVIILQLGFNDGSTYIQDMQYLISAIKEEFPSMIIALSFVDASGSYYPDLWPGWQTQEKDISFLQPMDIANGYGYSKRLHDKMMGYYNSIKALEDVSNKVFFLANNVIEPTANSVPSADNSEPGIFGLKGYTQRATDAFAYHPNNTAHAIWGYHLYSFINYLCASTVI